MKKNIIPKAYRRSPLTKLLYLYKIGYISRYNYINCKKYLELWENMTSQEFREKFCKDYFSTSKKYYSYKREYILKEKTYFTKYEKEKIYNLVDKTINFHYGLYVTFLDDRIIFEWWTD